MSTNVDDRRKKGGTAAKVGGGIGIGGIIIALIVWFLGGEAPNVGNILQDVQSTASTWVDSKTQEQMATKCSQFLASTEDFWTEEFEKVGGYYRQPKLVLYSDTVTTGCQILIGDGLVDVDLPVERTFYRYLIPCAEKA